MLRRPPTAIELKLDDIRGEYDSVRQQLAREQQEKSKSHNDSSAFGQTGPKSKEEIQARIGYVPEKPQASQARPNIM